MERKGASYRISSGAQLPAVPTHPKRHIVAPRQWGAEPENRMVNHAMYRRTTYGQATPPPPSSMISNMRRQEAFRRPVD